MKKKETKHAISNFFIAVWFDFSRAAFLAAKFIGVLAGSGVP
jgi:hypothetical protein